MGPEESDFWPKMYDFCPTIWNFKGSVCQAPHQVWLTVTALQSLEEDALKDSGLWLVMLFAYLHPWPRYLHSYISLTGVFFRCLCQSPLKDRSERRGCSEGSDSVLSIFLLLALPTSPQPTGSIKVQESFVWGPSTVRQLPHPYWFT